MLKRGLLSFILVWLLAMRRSICSLRRDDALLIQRPFDSALARFIPAGTPLAVFDNDLASGYRGALGQLTGMAMTASGQQYSCSAAAVSPRSTPMMPG